MIKKLVKNDIKDMSKILVYIYVITLALAIVTRLISLGSSIQILDIISKVFAGITYSAIANVIINNFTHILKVFIDSFYKDESYLTHTLPVTKGELLLSKYIASFILTTVSVIVSVVSFLIIHYSSEFFNTIKFLLEMGLSGFNMSIGLFLTLMVILLFTQFCCIISMTFTAVIKGNTYNSKRILKGLIWFFVYYFGSSVIVLLTALIAFLVSGNIGLFLSSSLTGDAMIMLLVIALVVYTLIAIWCSYISYRLFKKGVNID